VEVKDQGLVKGTWNKLLKNKLAFLGILIIAFFALIAVLGSLIRPDSTPDANDQILEISRKKPGFEVSMLEVELNKEVQEIPFYKRLFFGGQSLSYQNIPIEKYNIHGDSLIAILYNEIPSDRLRKKFHVADVLFSLDISKPIIKIGSQYEIPLVNGELITTDLHSMVNEIPNRIHPQKYILGTDKFGRDLLSRVMAGAVVSLSVGFIAVFISLIIGITLGAIAGYYRGWVDELIMWLINVVWSVPTILLVIAVTLALGKGFSQVFIAVGLTMWVEVARVVRGQILGIREKEFVEAGKALGYSNSRIIVKHILPNIMGPVIVISAANFASAILIEAGLSFLGIGAQIPMPSWGGMIKDHYHYITTNLAYLAIVPGICIMLLVLAFMLVGNGLREALDIKSGEGI
jgi:peptide/nickel transport system permease protein